jgi:hypothetical protein
VRDRKTQPDRPVRPSGRHDLFEQRARTGEIPASESLGAGLGQKAGIDDR